MENIDISAKLIIHICTIFGWFWLITFTIYRFGYFKKRLFSLLILVYFSQGIAKISELLISDFNLDNSLWMYQFTNICMIFGYYILTNRLAYLKNKYGSK